MVGITGADGFIGTHLIKKLNESNIACKQYIEGGDLPEFVKDLDTVIHLAGRSVPPDDLIMTSNVGFTKELLKSLQNSKVKRIIFLSTVAVCADSHNPKDVYGRSKLEAENLIKIWGEKNNTVVQILRPFNVYGQGNKKGLVYEFYRSIKKYGSVIVYGDGSIKRDLLYIDDLANAIVKTISHEKNFEADVVYGKDYTLLEIVKVFEKVLGRKIKINFEKENRQKPKNIKVSNIKAKETLSWSPKISFEEGLRRTIKWYEENK